CVNTPGSFVCQCQPGFRAQAPACGGEPGSPLHHCSPGLRTPSFQQVFTAQLCPSALRSGVSSFHSVSRYEELIYVHGPLLGSCVSHVAGGCLITRVSYVDECLESPAVCGDGPALCENTLGSYKCVCPAGYQGNGTHCEDENECASGAHGCDPNARCGNIIGSYFCQCHQGFSGDGRSCYDIDECAMNNARCEHNCSNESGGYSCQCAAGFRLDQDGHNCTDVDECLALSGTCEHLCINTQGSFQCSCRAGYQLHIDAHTCVDIDECKLHNGGCSHSCSNTVGGHVCHCPPPLLLAIDNLTCSDVRSCKLRNGGCEHTCALTAEGRVRCSCRSGWKLDVDLRSCVDVNECGDFTNGGCEQLCANHPAVCDPPCNNYGVCIAPNSCDCPPGYPGPGCSGTNLGVNSAFLSRTLVLWALVSRFRLSGLCFSHVLPTVRPRWHLHALEQVSVPSGLDWSRLPHSCDHPLRAPLSTRSHLQSSQHLYLSRGHRRPALPKTVSFCRFKQEGWSC
ncbi:unnamed protein product, partial [Tetraodon nigroviridis]